MNRRVGRSALAVLVLPGVVAVLVPLLLAPEGLRGFRILTALPLSGPGVTLLAWCVREFHMVGRGTLAPWDPPRELVASGPYRVSRNPMYLAVLLILGGWAAGFRSWLLAGYAVGMAAVFHLRVLLHEEPWLARTHGERWLRYRTRVPRWVGLRSARDGSHAA